VSVPVVENIAVNIAAAINAITTANQFNQDLVAVRPKRLDFSDVMPENGKVLIVQEEDAALTSKVSLVEDLRQQFVLMAIVIDSDDATTSIDTRINQVRADIRKKLLEDGRRGGNANRTLIVGSGKFSDARGFSGIAVVVDVEYRTVYNDPYTKS